MLNSVLSTLPLYWLSLYKLHVNIRNQIDRIRKKFLWSGGCQGRRKYHLINWTTICLPKDQCGLGVLDLNTMNIALLAKWWFHFKDPTVTGKWKLILSAKFGTNGLSVLRYSSFCYGILANLIRCL